MATINPSELDLLEESVIKINRTAKVTSRGKRFRFSAFWHGSHKAIGVDGAVIVFTVSAPHAMTTSLL